MITEKVKATAIAKLKHKIPPETIAAQLDIPVKLVKDWAGSLNGNDMMAIESNIHAVQVLTDKNAVANGEIVPLNEDVLRETLELTAIDLAKAATMPGTSADIVHAKSIQACADAITKLYQTFILKGATGEPSKPNDGQGQTLFQQLMKD